MSKHAWVVASYCVCMDPANAPGAACAAATRAVFPSREDTLHQWMPPLYQWGPEPVSLAEW